MISALKGPKRFRWVETRLPHRAISLVEQRTQPIVFRIVELRTVVSASAVGLEILQDAVVVGAAAPVQFRRDYFGSGSFTEIVVAREPGLGRSRRSGGGSCVQ